MTTFNFLPLVELRRNIKATLVDVENAHLQKKTATNNNRQNHNARIHSLMQQSQIFNEVSDDDLLEQHKKCLLEYHDILSNLPDTKSDEYKSLKRKKEAIYDLTNKMIKTKLASTMDNEIKQDDQLVSAISNEQWSKIITGLMLAIKKEIEIEYSGITNVLLGIIVTNKPDNSELYKRIDEAIGVTKNNQLDDVSKEEALAAYKSYSEHPKLPLVHKYIAISDEIKNLNVAAQLKKVELPNESQSLGVIREAKPDEKMIYNNNRNTYFSKDIKRVAESWKGVPDPVEEKSDVVSQNLLM